MRVQRPGIRLYLPGRAHHQAQERARHRQSALNGLPFGAIAQLAPQNGLAEIRRAKAAHLPHIIQRKGIQPNAKARVKHAAFFQQALHIVNGRAVRRNAA